MNKSELIEALATKADLSKAAAGRAVDVLVEEIVTAVAKGDSVTLVGFGTFKSAARAAREGKNPKTGEKLKIAATTVPKFSAEAQPIALFGYVGTGNVEAILKDKLLEGHAIPLVTARTGANSIVAANNP